MASIVHRCSTCAAPLETGGERLVTCEYCGSENRLVADPASADGAALFADAAAEADQMDADNEEKIELLTERAEQAFAKGNKQAALKYQEGIMRLSYAPTIHMYKSMDPSNPQVAAALEQIDQSIDGAMEALAAEWGVEYVPVAQRKG